MSKLFRLVLVTFALMGVASVVGCGGGGNTDAGDAAVD